MKDLLRNGRPIIPIPRALSFSLGLLLVIFLAAAAGRMNNPKVTNAAVGGNVLASPGAIALGAFIPLPNPTDFSPLDRFAQQVGKMPAILWKPQFWEGGNTRFPTGQVDAFRRRGAFPMITWSPTAGVAQQHQDQPSYSWASIASGAHDPYITTWATDARKYGFPLAVRLMHEMNGNAYPWSIGVNGNNDPADFVRAWRHIVDIFRTVGAHNVEFVWCVETGAGTRNDAALYPGDDYVDWTAMDGYNAYPQQQLSLYDRFEPTYETLTTIASKPIMISEVASVENPLNASDKANWIKEGFLQTIPQSFPQVRAVMWFNRVGWQPTMNFPVDSSADSLAAYRQVVADPYYQGTLAGPTPVPTGTATPAVTATSAGSAFSLSSRVQTTHHALWNAAIKSASRIKEGQRITLALYLHVQRAPRGTNVRLEWKLLRKARVIAHHVQQSQLKSEAVQRLWKHWDRRLVKPSTYTFTGTAEIDGVTKAKSISFVVHR